MAEIGNASTIAPAREPIDAYMAASQEIQGDEYAHARLESRALSLLTDDQAMATWERFKAVQKAYVATALSEISE
jgi:hypothetical protein